MTDATTPSPGPAEQHRPALRKSPKTPKKKPETFADRYLPDGWEYVLPMAVFLLLIWVGGFGDYWYVASYATRAVLCLVIIGLLWKRYTRISWSHWKLGVVVGVVGLVQWVGMESLLVIARDNTTGVLHLLLNWTSMASPADAFRPDELFQNPAALWAFFAIRLFGAVVTVPIMEELFWRDWLWRTLASPNGFRRFPVGGYDREAFWLVPVFFAFVHVQLLTAVVWALLIAWLLVKTRSIGACIIAHAVTNLLLGLYVIAFGYIWPSDDPLAEARVWYFW
ncbi:MAG: CAAX prenyl protease-related protein [Phycisphaerae bacterium]